MTVCLLRETLRVLRTSRIPMRIAEIRGRRILVVWGWPPILILAINDRQEAA